jgi:hypothetical protein
MIEDMTSWEEVHLLWFGQLCVAECCGLIGIWAFIDGELDEISVN